MKEKQKGLLNWRLCKIKLEEEDVQERLFAKLHLRIIQD